jgi:hypothetical protein
VTIAPPERKACLQEQLDLLQSGVRDAITGASDRSSSSRRDAKGLG